MQAKRPLVLQWLGADRIAMHKRESFSVSRPTTSPHQDPKMTRKRRKWTRTRDRRRQAVMRKRSSALTDLAGACCRVHGVSLTFHLCHS